MFNPKMEIMNQRRMSIGNKFPISTKFLIFFAIIFAAVPSLFSQGQLSVLVTDFDQFPLPGVTVTLYRPELKEEWIGVTNTKGAYHFTGLPIGLYQIKFELPGFKILIRENIKVSSTTLPLKVSLEVEQISEDITVVAVSPIVDTSPSVTFSEGLILKEASLSLHGSIDITRNRLTEITDIDTKRHILMDVSKNWLDNLAETQTILMASTQNPEKRNIFKAFFGGTFQRLNASIQSVQSSPPPEFEQQATNLLAEYAIVSDVMAHMEASGEPTFNLEVVSYPSEAKVTYWRSASRAVEHHKRTPTTIKNLEYAIWYLKLELEEYNTEKITYDALKDDSHSVHRHLRRKKQ